MAKLSKRKRTARIVPRVKVWIEIDGSYVFGPINDSWNLFLPERNVTV